MNSVNGVLAFVAGYSEHLTKRINSNDDNMSNKNPPNNYDLENSESFLLNISKDFPHSPTRKGLVISKCSPSNIKPLQFCVSDSRGHLCSVSHVSLRSYLDMSLF